MQSETQALTDAVDSLVLNVRRAGDVLLVLSAAVLELLVWGGERQVRGGGEAPGWVVPVVVTATSGILLFRRRRPLQAFLVQWVAGFVGVLLPGFQPFAGILIGLHAAARWSSLRSATLALAACVAPFGINSYNATLSTRRNPLDFFVISIMLWAAVSGAVWGFGRRGHAVEQHTEHARAEREAQTARAVRAERLQLARELHDIVANTVSAMLLQAAGARTLVEIDDEQVRRSLGAIEQSGVQAMGELHRLLGLLRAEGSAADAEGAWGEDGAAGLEELDRIVDEFRGLGLDVHTEVDGVSAGVLDPSVAVTAARVLQEALTNANKYAGRHAIVLVRQQWEPEWLNLTVRDSAGLAEIGSPPVPSSGHGIPGLEERVTLVGGALEAGPVNGGFLVHARLPVRTRSAPPAPEAVTGHE